MSIDLPVDSLDTVMYPLPALPSQVLPPDRPPLCITLSPPVTVSLTSQTRHFLDHTLHQPSLPALIIDYFTGGHGDRSPSNECIATANIRQSLCIFFLPCHFFLSVHSPHRFPGVYNFREATVMTLVDTSMLVTLALPQLSPPCSDRR